MVMHGRFDYKLEYNDKQACRPTVYSRVIALYMQHVHLNVHGLGGQKNQTFYVAINLQNVTFRSFGNEMGRRGSPRAHTLSGWSHAAPDHFKIPPRPHK